MRILFLLPEFPYPPSTGGRSKVFNELSYLSRAHKCDLLCYGETNEENMKILIDLMPNVTIHGVIKPLSGIKRLIRVTWMMMRFLPPSFAKYSSSKFSSKLSRLLHEKKYDVVHYDIVNMAQYLSVGKFIASVHSPNDATSLSYSRMAEQENRFFKKASLLLSSMLLRKFEENNYPLFSKVHVVSPIDAEYLYSLSSKIDLEVIPITIDSAFLDNKYSNKLDLDDASYKTIICTGNFGNASIARGLEEFLLCVYPLILQTLPKVRLLILGQNPDDALKLLMKETKCAEFFSWVDDYREFLSQADVVLTPDLAGTGIKTRVIQAMGLGLPVVGTDIAFEGIPIVDGVHGYIYKSSAECTDIFIQLLRSNEQRKKSGENAHLLAEEEFSLSVVGPRYEKLYISAIEKNQL